MKKIKLILIVLGAVILMGLVFSSGYGLGIRQIKVEQPPAFELLKSPTVQALNAMVSGEVREIINRTLSLVANGEVLKVPIKEGAEIVSFIITEPPAEINEDMIPPEPERKELKFEDIKVGDKVSIVVEVKPTGEIEGINVTVLPE